MWDLLRLNPARHAVLPSWEREQVIEPGRTSKRQEDASFQRRAASSVSYANCLQELEEALQRFKKAAVGSVVHRSLCIKLQLTDGRVYPADRISAKPIVTCSQAAPKKSNSLASRPSLLFVWMTVRLR